MFPAILHFFWSAIQAFTAFSLVAPALLCLLYFVRRYYKEEPVLHEELHEEKDYAIVVSACEPVQNIQATLQSLLRLNYSNYIIYVVGNSFTNTGVRLHNDKIVYLRTTAAHHSHIRMHRLAIESFRRPHTHVAFLDGNSLADANYLTNLNSFFHEGYQAVKARILLQNNKSIGSTLQTLADLYRNFFTNEVLFSLGSSSTLSSSGTAFSVSFYKHCIRRMKEGGADFTSDLQTKIMQSGRQVAFASGAIIYNTVEISYYQMMKLHAQQIHNWLFCLLSNSRMAVKGLLKGDTNQLVYGLTAFRMPLSTGAFIGLACLAVNIKIDPLTASFWTGIFFLLPAYLVTAAAQSRIYRQPNKTEEQNIESLFEAISLEDKSDYNVMMQTV